MSGTIPRICDIRYDVAIHLSYFTSTQNTKGKELIKEGTYASCFLNLECTLNELYEL